MKKTALALFASLLLFGSACTAKTTVEAGAAATTQDASSEQPATEQSGSDQRAPSQAATSDESAVTVNAAPADQADDAVQADEPATQDSTAVEDAANAAQDASAAEASASTSNAVLGSDDWCAVANQVEDSFDNEALDIFGEPGSLEDALTASTALMNQAVEIAPPAIANDVATVAQASNTMIALLTDADWDFLAVDFEQFEAISGNMEQAGYNIQKYNFEVCGVGEDPDVLGTGIDGFDEDVDIDELLDSDVARSIMASTLAGFGIEDDDAACVIEEWSAVGFEDPSGMILGMQACGVPLETITGG